jgi:proteasome lid subunit RPN8/RPN11
MKQLLTLARKYQYEICGIMSCTPDGEPAEMYECVNVAHRPEHMYKIGHQQQERIFLRMDASGEQLQAIYHSHPQSPPVPSMEDIRNAYYPDAIYVIIGVDSAGMYLPRAYSIIDGAVFEQTIEVI